MADAGTPTYPVATIAKLLNLTPRRVQQLSKDGVIPKSERGRYELAPAVQGYVRYLQERIAPQADEPGTIDYHVEKARKMKADADISELEAARKKGEVVDAGEMREAMQLVISEARANLLNNVPTRIAALGKSETEESKLKAIAKSEISAALKVMSETHAGELLGKTL